MNTEDITLKKTYLIADTKAQFYEPKLKSTIYALINYVIDLEKRIIELENRNKNDDK